MSDSHASLLTHHDGRQPIGRGLADFLHGLCDSTPSRYGASASPKPFHQKLSYRIGAAVILLCGFILAFPQAAWKNRVIAQVSICRAATVDVNRATLGRGLPDIAGMEHPRIEQNRRASGSDEVLRRIKTVSVKRRSFRGLRRAGQDAEGVRCVIHIREIKDHR